MFYTKLYHINLFWWTWLPWQPSATMPKFTENHVLTINTYCIGVILILLVQIVALDFTYILLKNQTSKYPSIAMVRKKTLAFIFNAKKYRVKNFCWIWLFCLGICCFGAKMTLVTYFRKFSRQGHQHFNCMAYVIMISKY